MINTLKFAHVLLYGLVGESLTNQTFAVKDGILRIHGSLAHGGVPQQPLGVIEGNVGRGGVVGNDLDPVVLPHSHTAVASAQVNAYSFDFFCCHWKSLAEKKRRDES